MFANFLGAGMAREYGHVTHVQDKAANSFAVKVSIGHADVSVVDHTPEELLNLTVSGALQTRFVSRMATWALASGIRHQDYTASGIARRIGAGATCCFELLICACTLFCTRLAATLCSWIEPVFVE